MRCQLSGDSYGRVAGCCEHRQEPSDFLKGEERFHLAILNLSSSYLFTLKSPETNPMDQTLTLLPSDPLFPPSSYFPAVKQFYSCQCW